MFDLFRDYYIENNYNDVSAFIGLMDILDENDKDAYKWLVSIIYSSDELEDYLIKTLANNGYHGLLIGWKWMR